MARLVFYVGDRYAIVTKLVPYYADELLRVKQFAHSLDATLLPHHVSLSTEFAMPNLL